jgi:DNA-binding CsgD family transcriptional regulator
MEEETPGRREGQYFDGFTWKSIDEKPDKTVQQSRNSELDYELSGRELEILQMMTGKMTAKAMAESLKISHRTVQFHMDSMYWKLGCSGRDSRLQAVTKGRKLGLVK